MSLKISVIMPVYNTAQYVWEAIESVLSQTFSDFEFIIVDDGSTDGSDKIIESYAQKDPRISFYKNDKNRWIAFTRNRLFSLVNTEIVATQDSDDVSRNDRFEKEYNFLIQNKNCGAVSSDTEIIDENGKIIWFRSYRSDIRNVLLKKNPLANPANMLRKSIFDEIGGYREWLDIWEDYDLWLRMYAKGYTLSVINEPLLKLRIRSGQTKSEKLKEHLWNSIKLQKRAIVEYWIDASLSDKLYIFCEQILYFFPSAFVLWLFKLIEYRKWK
jgi:glycosyltransferase involved in cell wall biosynthesis